MSELRIKAPDGLIRTIRVPDGADPQPAYDWVKKDYEERQSKAKAENDPTAGMSGLERTMAGIGSGFVNKGLGIQQFLNAITRGAVGDKDKLNAEVAEKKALDRPLTGGGLTTLGGAGEAVGELLPDLLLGGPTNMLRSGAARMLPGAAARGAFRVPAALATGAAEGALQNATTAAKDYDLGREAKQGALYGVGGEVVGRAAGRVAAPFRNTAPSRTAAEQFDVLERAGIPAPTAQTMTDAPNVGRFTHAVAQLPIFNRSILNSHEANLGWFTNRKTGLAGSPMTELPPSKTAAVEQRLEDAANAFRAGPDVPLTNVPAELANLHANAADTIMATGGNQNKLIQLLNNATAQPTYSAKAIMDARQSMSRQQRGHNTAGRYFDADQARKLKHIYENALTATHPDGGTAFNQWKRQHGAWQDVANAASEGGGKTARQLEPTEFAAKNMDERTRLGAQPGTEEAFTAAAAGRIPKLPSTENRAWITALLMGSPLLAGGAGGVFGDKPFDENWAASAAVPLGGLYLASQLLGTKGGARYMLGRHRGQGQTARDVYRRLLTAGAQQAHD